MKELKANLIPIFLGICTVCCLYSTWKLNVLENNIRSNWYVLKKIELQDSINEDALEFYYLNHHRLQTPINP